MPRIMPRAVITLLTDRRSAAGHNASTARPKHRSRALALHVRISEEAVAEMAEAARWYEMHRAGLGTEF
jgi:hypothetical protein